LNETKSESQATIHLNTYATIEYEEVFYEDIATDRKWNYMGLFPVYSKRSEIQIYHDESSATNYGDSSTGEFSYYNSITITPKGFRQITITQKRDSTVLGIFGSIGGVLGLIAGLQVFLFGTRPSTPWGVFHYWTWKKASTPHYIGDHFHIEDAQVPFINPVHQRFTDVFNKNSDRENCMDTSSSSSTPLIDKDSIEDRMSRLEARNQLLELVMKNYYLDDQVFLALGHSQRISEEDAQQEKKQTK
jgi:hypothetical protein